MMEIKNSIHRGIYVIESPTGAIYVGQSCNIQKRWMQYKNLHCKDQQRIYNSLKKHGPENHKFTIQMYFSEKTPQSVVDRYENDYIEVFKSNGFNMMNLRGGGASGKMSEETKSKISAARKGKPCMALRGRKLSPEHIEKMKAWRANQVFTPETCAKISQSLREVNRKKGFKPKPKVKYPRVDGKFSEEQRKVYSEERSGEKNQFFGKKHTPATIAIFSKIASERTGMKNGRSRAIIQFDLKMNIIKEWDYITKASVEMGINRLAISSALASKTGKSNGFIWKYKTPKVS